MQAKSLPPINWTPIRDPSPGAKAYHKAIINTSWHKANIQGLKKIVQAKIKEGDTVVDFGAGTGASATFLLKYIKKDFNLLLIDNSPSWLTKAYELLQHDKRTSFIILEKRDNTYSLLDQVVGPGTVDHVISANTVHLIPSIEETFKGISNALKENGWFIFQSGNIYLENRSKGILMIDDSINEIHDLAIEIIRSDKKFAKYKRGLNARIAEQISQRKFVFPTPKPIEIYLQALRDSGFKKEFTILQKPIKVLYNDWMQFLRVRRLQSGILPEIGGKDPSPQEEIDRDKIITQAARQLFKKLKTNNALATDTYFTSEWIYVHAEK